MVSGVDDTTQSVLIRFQGQTLIILIVKGSYVLSYKENYVLMNEVNALLISSFWKYFNYHQIICQTEGFS